MGDLERTWKVGELARATGLTIRALHHYDDIGLLVPGRTERGHRVYSPADVERLYRVLALRGVGIALDDIARALERDGVSLVDTVRRHVAAVERDIAHRQRLLDRLREMLATIERAASPTVEELLGAVEAMSVVEATIEDVVTREPWQTDWEIGPPSVVLLRATGADRILPIWIGEPEAAALVVHRRGMTLSRPMTPDLTVALLAAIAARVDRVVIERLEGNTFFATVTVSIGGNGEQHEVDARPSDALNIALRTGAPIHVATDLMEQAGVAVWPTPGGLGGADGEPEWLPLLESGQLPATRRYAVDEGSSALLKAAATEARDLGHGAVRAAHLLLALLSDDGPAAQTLARHGVTLAAARAAAEADEAPSPSAPPVGEPLPIGSRATFTLMGAAHQARRRRAAVVTPLHVLWALVVMPDAARIPGLADRDIEALRADVRAALDAG